MMSSRGIAGLLVCAASLAAAAPPRFGVSAPVLDLRQFEWEVIPENGASTPAAAMSRTDWKPVRVGQRWDEMGHPELQRGNYWARLRFLADPGLRGREAGFFATLIDDEADIYLNGANAGSARFSLGDLVRGPADVKIGSHLRLGAENTLLVHLRDTYPRATGIVGNVCLYQTLPYSRTRWGGIEVRHNGPLSVALHVGSALLSQGGRTAFSAAQLQTLRVPPYILRADELILVVPAAQAGAGAGAKLRVELDNVNPTVSDRPLMVRTAKLPASVERYGLLDLPLDLQATFDNPFDPAQINVQAFIETPSRRIEKVSAFFRQEFERTAPSDEEEVLLPAPGPAWRIYYRPRELGVHKMEIVAQDRSGMRKYEAGSFESVAGALPGYLRVSKRDPKYFEYDNGDSFFAIGPSGWYRGRDFIFGGQTRWVSSKKLEDYYERKAANRSNYEYLGTFHFGRILLDGGVVDQHIAWKLEHSLRTMERLGIRWLYFHDDICRMSRYGFDTLPYARNNGGPARELNELYFGETSLAWQKNELRYLVARMADSPSIWMWNIGDEWRRHFGNKFSIAMVRSWIQELHAAVKRMDIYGHPHAIGEGDESILNGGDVYLLEDWYLNHILKPGADWRSGPKRDVIEYCTRQVSRIGERTFPTINVEGGLYAWNTLVYQSGKPWQNPEAITFHQHLWLGLFLENAASGTDWLVNVLDRDGQLYHSKALANYLDGVHLTAAKWERRAAATSDPKLTAFALASERGSLAWVMNRTWNWLDWVEGRKPAPLSGQSVTLPVERNGAYRVELWDTGAGKVAATVRAEARDGRLTVALPAIETDIALKCFPQ